MIIQSIKTSKLSKNKIKQILILKDSIWNFGIKSQRKWFNDNVKDKDVHNILFIKNKVVGYTLLAKRHFIQYKNKKPINKKNYILFSTLILKKKYRNFLNASQLMRFNNKYILSKKRPAFLLCHKNKLNFYKLFGWSSLRKKSFSTRDHKHSLEAMIYNFKLFKKNDQNFYNFYYHR